VRTWRLFDLSLASDFPFASALASLGAKAFAPGSDSGRPDLTFSHTGGGAPAASDLAGRAALYTTPFRGRDGSPYCRFYRTPAGEALRFAGTDFHLGAREIHARGTAPAAEVEEQLLGPVLAFWLEQRGIVALHASAVALDGAAVAFLAPSGAGKSSLAAALVAAGGVLLTDDLLALDHRGGRPHARAGYPQLRLAPSAAARWAGSRAAPPVRDGDKCRVPVGDGGWGAFCGAPVPLVRLVLPSRGGATAPVELAPLGRREALIELVRHSYVPRLTEAAGLQPARLARLARLVARVPARRLVYPTGHDRLPEVVAALARDLAADAAAPADAVLGSVHSLRFAEVS
jgi:hypothetical protein